MNKKLKCIIAAMLIAALAVSAVIIPASAASEQPAPADEGSVLADVRIEETFSEKADLAAIGAEGAVQPIVEETAAPAPVPTSAPDNGSTTIGAVTSAKRTTNSADRIGLSWNAVAGAKGYRVFWRNADTNASFTQLTTVKGNALTVRGLKAGAMYEFKISAYKTVDGSMIEGKAITTKAATNPVKVSDFRMTSCASTGTVMKWTKNGYCDGFIIYREFDGKWSKYKTLGKDASSYTDSNVTPGRAYNYRIYTYRNDSTGNMNSDYVQIRTVSGLSAPADNGTASFLRKMHFKWKKSSYANGYEIFYSTDGKTFTQLIDTTKLYYITQRLPVGKKYDFRIYPYRYVGKSKTKVYGTYLAKTVTIIGTAYGKKVPNTYIEVSIEQQHLWFYLNDELYVSTDVVTGNCNSMDTPKGYWAVNNKASPCSLVGAGYVSYVQYWMAFIGSGYGIHDASWRSTFGGTIYKGNGSHGCINTPYNNVKKMYSKVKVGTPVIVY